MCQARVLGPKPRAAKTMSAYTRRSSGERHLDLLWRAIRRAAAALPVVSVVLYVSAGRLSWTRGWAFFGLLAFTMLANGPIVLRPGPCAGARAD